MPKNPYRFSPITTKAAFEEAIAYVAEEAHAICKQITGKRLPLHTVCIFAHYPEEEKLLRKLLATYGAADEDASHGTTTYVRPTGQVLQHEHVQLLGVRGVDPYRMHVGYADFTVPNYQQFVETHSGTKKGWARPVPAREHLLFELWHPDYDVFAYVVNR
ncbi:MAG TPA: hypothetical protein VLI54_03060 [Bacillota bacterium]|nr:hypothetical protein [Bacillota bacterium]